MTKVQCAWQRSTARVLMIIAMVFWLWFGIGSSYAGRAGPLTRLLHMPVPGGVFILSMLLSWRWEGIGGALLVLRGIVALGFIVQGFLRGTFTTSNPILMCLTLALPPLAAGVLFLTCWRQSAVANGRHKASAAG